MRTCIGRNHSHNLSITAIEQNIGYGGFECGSLGDRQKVSLAFGLSNFNEVVRCKPSRACQDRRGDGNFVMACQASDHSAGRITDGSKALSEIDKRALFDPLRKEAQNVVEDLYLLVVETIGVVQE